MKATIEIPDEVFKNAESAATLRGLSLQDLMTDGLVQLLTAVPAQTPPKKTVVFPLIKAQLGASAITSETVAQAEMHSLEEEDQKNASFMRR